MPLSRVTPEHYDAVLAAKIGGFREAFLALGAPTPAIYPSAPLGFRLRAEFRLWHTDNQVHYVMFSQEAPKTPVIIDQFPIGSPAIQALMPTLLAAINASEVLRRKIFQLEFLTTLAGDKLVTLIYHRTLNEDWQVAAETLAADLGIYLVGRSRKQKRVVGGDWVTETLSIRQRDYYYRQPEQAFTQPNGHVNETMIDWAVQQSTHLGDDLLELYCGIGNFTLPLAEHFNHVIATELSKKSTAAAEFNRVTNGIDNIEFARLSAEEMSSALAGERLFQRLAHLKKPLANYSLNTLLVDPPRAGLDDKTLDLASTFDNIIYISCNPETLLNNLTTLTRSHTIEQLAFFDQFPYTPHLESGVLLRRKDDSITT